MDSLTVSCCLTHLSLFSYFHHFFPVFLHGKRFLLRYHQNLCLTFVMSWSWFWPHDFSPFLSYLEDLPWYCPPVNFLCPHHLLPWGATFCYQCLTLTVSSGLTEIYAHPFLAFYKPSSISVGFHTSPHLFLLDLISSSPTHLFCPSPATEAGSAHALTGTVRCS